MARTILVVAALSLALGALLLMFMPLLGEFTALRIGGEQLALGAFVVGALGAASVASARLAAIALGFVLVMGTLIAAAVATLPASINLVPNPVSYINVAESQLVFTCFIAGFFAVAGGVAGGLLRAKLAR